MFFFCIFFFIYGGRNRQSISWSYVTITTVISFSSFLLTTLQKIIHYFSKQERIGNYVKEINLAYWSNIKIITKKLREESQLNQWLWTLTKTIYLYNTDKEIQSTSTPLLRSTNQKENPCFFCNPCYPKTSINMLHLWNLTL